MKGKRTLSSRNWEIIKPDSKFGKKIGFTSDKFEKCSYISRNGNEIRLSAVFDRLDLETKKRMIRKMYKHNRNLAIPTNNISGLIRRILKKKTFLFSVPDFIYYRKMFKELGFRKAFYYEDKMYHGSITIWKKYLKNNNKNIIPKDAVYTNYDQNVQTLNYYSQEALFLLHSYIVDVSLMLVGKATLQTIKTALQILNYPMYLVKLRLIYLRQKGIISINRKERSLIASPSFISKWITLGVSDPREYCQKMSLFDIAKIINQFYNDTKLVKKFNKRFREMEAIWDN